MEKYPGEFSEVLILSELLAMLTDLFYIRIKWKNNLEARKWKKIREHCQKFYAPESPGFFSHFVRTSCRTNYGRVLGPGIFLFFSTGYLEISTQNFDRWNQENMFETEVIRANECQSYHHVRRHSKDIFSIFYNTKVCSVFSLQSLHRGDSNEYTQYTILNIKNP